MERTRDKSQRCGLRMVASRSSRAFGSLSTELDLPLFPVATFISAIATTKESVMPLQTISPLRSGIASASIVILAALVSTGCSRSSHGCLASGLVSAECPGACHGRLASGSAVNASSDSINLSSQFGEDTAEIHTAGKTILVQPTALVVDGVKVADIDKDVADVRVDVKRGVVSFVADGKPVELVRR